MLPPELKPNDKIRIVSPSGNINSEYIDGAAHILTSWGYGVTEGKYCRSEYGRFAGTEAQRAEDLQNALDDAETKAILCSRGGYGLAQIIDRLDFSSFIRSPKWLIGFSDITILHSAINNAGIASLHSIMAKHLSELSENDDAVVLLKNILVGNLPQYKTAAQPLNRSGEAAGTLIGGNLSVLAGLRGTPFDLKYENNILFIEDTDEEPYHIDRMMQNLRLGGALDSVSGLIVGQFSDCTEDPRMMKTISEIIGDSVSRYNYPVCFGFLAGHVDENLPLVLGAKVNLTVNNDGAKLSYSSFL